MNWMNEKAYRIWFQPKWNTLDVLVSLSSLEVDNFVLGYSKIKYQKEVYH